MSELTIASEIKDKENMLKGKICLKINVLKILIPIIRVKIIIIIIIIMI